MSKVPLIAFSGGMKSTYLLAQTLKEGPCDVMYVAGIGKTPKEDAAQCDTNSRIIRALQSKCRFRVRNEYQLPFDANVLPDLAKDLLDEKYLQIFALFNAAKKVKNPYYHSNVQLAHCSSEWEFSQIKTLQIAFKVVEDAGNISEYGCTDLEFPLIHTSQSYLKNLFGYLSPLAWAMRGTDFTQVEIELMNQLAIPSKTMQTTEATGEHSVGSIPSEATYDELMNFVEQHCLLCVDTDNFIPGGNGGMKIPASRQNIKLGMNVNAALKKLRADKEKLKPDTGTTRLGWSDYVVS